MDELTERRLRTAEPADIPWPADAAPPVEIDLPDIPVPASFTSPEGVHSDEWLAGWEARRQACLEDLAAGYRRSYEDGRASAPSPILAVVLCATLAFIAGVVIGALIG